MAESQIPKPQPTNLYNPYPNHSFYNNGNQVPNQGHIIKNQSKVFMKDFAKHCQNWLNGVLGYSRDEYVSIQSLTRRRLEVGADVTELDYTICQQYSRNVYVLILKLHHLAIAKLDELSVLFRMRKLFNQVWLHFSGNLVKTTFNRFIVTFDHPINAIEAATSCFLLIQQHNLEYSQQVELTAGIDHNQILLLENDIFGNTIHLLTQITDDVAKGGELLLTPVVRDHIVEWASEYCAQLHPHQYSISKINTQTYQLVLNDTTAEFQNSIKNKNSALFVSDNTNSELTGENNNQSTEEVDFRKKSLEDLCLIRIEDGKTKGTSFIQDLDCAIRRKFEQPITIFSAHLNDFQRLWKRHGALHLLSLVIQQRAILFPLIKKNGGEILSFEGGNVLAFFPKPSFATRAALDAQRLIDLFNRKKLRDYQISTGIVIHCGSVICEKDLMCGEELDLVFHLGEDVVGPGETLMTEIVFDELSSTSIKEEFDRFEVEEGVIDFQEQNVKYFNLGTFPQSERMFCR